MMIGNTNLARQPSQQAPERRREGTVSMHFFIKDPEVEMYLNLRRPGTGALMDDYLQGSDFQMVKFAFMLTLA
jgi:hypothetical protein